MIKRSNVIAATSHVSRASFEGSQIEHYKNQSQQAKKTIIIEGPENSDDGE
jgi:hypothetical protein